MTNNFFLKKITISIFFFLGFVSIGNAEKIDVKTDVTYLGAFKLPDMTGDHTWEHSGKTLAFNPSGDKEGSSDGYPGSLYSSDYKNYVSEFSIPAPINSINLSDLNTAKSLTPFYDLTEGKLASTLVDAQGKKLNGLTFLGSQEEFIFWSIYDSYNVSKTNYPSHGYSNTDRFNLNSQGPWNVENFHSRTVAGYLFEIPEEWAENNVGGKSVATGVVRPGGDDCRGPALFTIEPQKYSDVSPPLDNELPTKALIYYNSEHDNYPDYMPNDNWSDGAWITAGTKEAVIFVGLKCLDNSCYGTSEECGDLCNPDKGYHCYPREPQIALYDTNDLADVAKGVKNSWDVLPYQTINLLEHIPHYGGCTATPGATYDKQNNLLYIIQYKGDNPKPLVHVFKIGQEGSIAPPSAPQSIIIKKS